MVRQNPFVSLVALLPTLAVSQQCDLQFDGRVPSDFDTATFNNDNGVFDPNNVFGQGLSLGSLVQLPKSLTSLFDQNTNPVEVTIRQARVQPRRYQLVFLESNDFSTNQFVLKTGTILGANTEDPDTLQLFGNVNADNVQTLFSTPFTEDVFHNFALTLDFDALTTQVFYSTGTDELSAQTDAVANDVSGQGQFHFGVLKKGLNGGDDIVKNGEQEDGIDEGIIFGGIFEEDSSDGCISLSA
ncbi:hypothetical protein F4808DRAFT_457384 [Astrocystis sublimbata]|nr:hypothetical protein F4808DRAFT_457384 [Astrocystis sublimbata]